MISFTSSMTYHLYTEAADMRKDIDGFCGILRSMGVDPTRRDHVYLFFQRNLKMVKVLYRGIGRYEMLKIRLDNGKFFRPVISGNRLSAKISWSDFVALTESVQQHEMMVQNITL